ncbi:MAG: DUF4124 domain-containing protein [Burkholderiaceae bacterium]
MKRALAIAAFGAAFSLPLHAADVYRWVDENGRTQLSDTVPEKYRKSAVKIDSRRYELSAEQRTEVDARTAAEKARLDEAQRKKALADAAAAASAPASAGSVGKTAARKPADPATDCETLQRLYRESEDCFAPFKTVGGATKAEAFQKCTVAESPVTKCGVPRTP